MHVCISILRQNFEDMQYRQNKFWKNMYGALGGAIA